MIAIYVLASLLLWLLVSTAAAVVTGRAVRLGDVAEGTADEPAVVTL